MTDLETANELSTLVRLDIDAVHACSQAIAEIGTVSIRDRLALFRQDHERHIRELCAVIRAFGVQPPECSPDLDEFLIEGFTAVRSGSGTEGALAAMKTNEEFTNTIYGEARALGFAPNIKELVDRNYRDEQLHLKFIEAVPADRPWEIK